MPRSKGLPDREVLEATARVLHREGPARFTLAHVASETGLSPATLLQRFGSKRGLILAFARAAAENADAPFVRARAEHASPIRALRQGLIDQADSLRSCQQVANSLAVLIDDIADDDMRTAAADHARKTERAIRGLLREAVAAGELTGIDPGPLALSVQAAWNGAVIQWALRGTGKFEAFLDRVLAPLLAAAETKPTRSKKR